MIRLCVVDDHGLFRDGIRAILEQTPDIVVAGEAEGAREAYALIERVACDVVLMDLRLRGSNGAAAVRELRRRGHRQPVLIMTMHPEDELVSEALQAGATGYALKEERREDLIRAIRTVAAGQRYFAPRLSREVIARALGTSGGEGDSLATLSPREREVFDLLLHDYSNEAIARELFISVRTVETHRAHLLRKLDLHSLSELVRFAVRKGLLSAESLAG
ncbi:MAG: response regulator transcription factor [Myxococcales bacterium]|nr:response regulator transcription factor [Myxococcales bacterium]